MARRSPAHCRHCEDTERSEVDEAIPFLRLTPSSAYGIASAAARPRNDGQVGGPFVAKRSPAHCRHCEDTERSEVDEAISFLRLAPSSACGLLRPLRGLAMTAKWGAIPLWLRGGARTGSA